MASWSLPYQQQVNLICSQLLQFMKGFAALNMFISFSCSFLINILLLFIPYLHPRANNAQYQDSSFKHTQHSSVIFYHQTGLGSTRRRSNHLAMMLMIPTVVTSNQVIGLSQLQFERLFQAACHAVTIVVQTLLRKHKKQQPDQQQPQHVSGSMPFDVYDSAKYKEIVCKPMHPRCDGSTKGHF